MMIISIHLPKTAGTSFIKTLESLCKGKVMKDYSDRPLNRSSAERKWMANMDRFKSRMKSFQHVECIHGHFMPYKYLSVKRQKVFITWLRDPVERLASHYYFWVNHYDPKQAFRLQRRVVEENWSFEQFALSKELQNVYSKFLWKFPIKNFDFIGITEYYTEDLAYFTRKYFNQEPQVFEENRNPQNPERYITDNSLRKDIEKFHNKDMELYNQIIWQRKEKHP